MFVLSFPLFLFSTLLFAGFAFKSAFPLDELWHQAFNLLALCPVESYYMCPGQSIRSLGIYTLGQMITSHAILVARDGVFLCLATHRSQAHSRGWGGVNSAPVRTRVVKESQGLCQKREGFLSTTVDRTKIYQMPATRGSSKFERAYKAWHSHSVLGEGIQRELSEAMNFRLRFEG